MTEFEKRTVTLTLHRDPSIDYSADRWTFLTGRDFHDVAHYAFEPTRLREEGIERRIAPMLSNYAMAIELYLKAHQTMDHGRPKRGHELDALFRALLPETRALIARHAQKDRAYEVDVAEVLSKLSPAFEAWRYAYELQKPQDISVSGLRHMAAALFGSILERRPEWSHEGDIKRLGYRPDPVHIGVIAMGNCQFHLAEARPSPPSVLPGLPGGPDLRAIGSPQRGGTIRERNAC